MTAAAPDFDQTTADLTDTATDDITTDAIPEPPEKPKKATGQKKTVKEPKKSAVDLVFQLLREADLYRTPDKMAYVGLRHEIYGTEGAFTLQHALTSHEARKWLTYHTYLRWRVTPTDRDLNDAIRLAEGWLEETRPSHEVYIRLAPICTPSGAPALDAEGCPLGFYLDTGWGERSIKVTRDGWKVGDFNATADKPDGPHFLRLPGMLVLPEPKRGGRFDVLRTLVNATPKPEEPDTADNWPLMAAFLLATVMPVGDYPFLLFNGPRGAGKSKTTTFMRSLVDPSTTPTCQSPKGWREVLLQANQSWVPAYDNLSALSSDLSDIFCELSTGFYARDRKYYTNDEALLYHLKRPCVVNGIGDLVSKDDLANRTLLVRLPSLDKTRGYTATTIEAAFTANHAEALGALLDLAVACLRHLPEARRAAAEESRKRLGDFYEWVLAAEMSGLLDGGAESPWPAGTWKGVWGRNEVRVVTMATLNQPYLAALRNYLADKNVCPYHQLRANAAELFTTLRDYARPTVDIYNKYVGWPAQATTGWSRITNSRAELELMGVTFTEKATNGQRVRTFVYGRSSDRTVADQRTTPCAPSQNIPDARASAPMKSDVSANGHDSDPVLGLTSETAWANEKRTIRRDNLCVEEKNRRETASEDDENRDIKERFGPQIVRFASRQAISDATGSTSAFAPDLALTSGFNGTDASRQADSDFVDPVPVLDAAAAPHRQPPTEATGDSAWERAFSLLPRCPNPRHAAKNIHQRTQTTCLVCRLPLWDATWEMFYDQPFTPRRGADGLPEDVEHPKGGWSNYTRAAAGAYLLLDQHLALPAENPLRRAYERLAARFAEETRKPEYQERAG